MLNGTFSSTSVRGWRQQQEGNITLPVTFSYINSIKNDIFKPIGANVAISDNGEFIYSAGITTFPPANIANSLRISYNYINDYNAYNISNVRPVPFDINGSGSLALTFIGNANIQINQFNNNLTFTTLGNIAIGNTPQQISVSGDGQYFGIALGSNPGYANIYQLIGNVATLQANIIWTDTLSTDKNININKTGNYAVITSPGIGNIMVYTRSGNSWSLEANISQSNVVGSVINDYGNIIAVNVDDAQDFTKIFSKIGNTWSTLNTFYGNIATLTARRETIDMNGSGDIIASSIRYTYSNAQPANNQHRVAIYNFDNANGNFILTQNVFQNGSNIDASIGRRTLALSKNTGYLVIHWGGTSSAGAGIELYSCL